MTFKRRRRTSLASMAVVAATFMSVAAGEPAVASHRQERDGHDHATATAPDEPPRRRDETRVDADGTTSLHQRHPEFRRRLARSAAEAFASWTPDKVARSTPLDLKIDVSTGDAYVQGLDGYLERYGDAFGHDSSRYWGSIVSVENIVEGADAHVQSAHESPNDGSRLYYKILEEDGIEPRTARRKGLRGQRGRGTGRALEERGATVFHLDSLGFGSSSVVDSHVDSPKEREEFAPQGEDDPAEDEEEEETLTTNQGRSLQGNHSQDLPQDHPSMTALGRKNNKKKKNNNNRKKKLPKIDQLNPSEGKTIRGKQTFSARVQPSAITQAAISEVSFQLEDHTGASSGWLEMPQVSDTLFEITVDGFDKYPKTKWKYTMEAKDEKGKKTNARDVSFVVGSTAGGSGCQFAGCDNDSPSSTGGEGAPSAPSHPPLRKTHVEDSNWPHEGAIKSATGRIMFEFDDGTDQSFVCSGTVVMDGRRGRSPDPDNGRTVVQTAAHCAYNDVLKKFASKAVFIPDQVNTRGEKSDFNAANDPYGAWYLSFATIASGWADGSFPENVPYDYAYYTVFDDRSTHEGGYLNGLSGILDHDVTPMAIDFDADPSDEFVHSIGYSADKDPRLRHCAMENTSINGVPWYTNLWLKDCALTGGASGGPWMAHMDQGGVGTLISVNSWGFTHKAGMAGPVLRTKEGSWAECLFTKARTANDPGKVGGIVVKSC